MKKGQEYVGYVERTDFPTKGVVELEENKIIVKGALPGEKIRFSINKARHGQYEGKLLEVLERSQIEDAVPVCPHFGICGGCSYQMLSYQQQLALKEEQVKRLLDGVCQSKYKWEPILGSPNAFEYRNKMEFSFGDAYKGGPLSLGLHKKGSFYDIVTTNQCKLVHPDFLAVLKSVLELYQEAGEDFYHKMTHQGYLRHLLVRRGAYTGELLVALVTAGKDVLVQESTDEKAATRHYQLLQEMTKRLLDLPLSGKVTGILHIENNRQADVVQADYTHVLYGHTYFNEQLMGINFRISTFSFFQTNSLGAEVLYSKVREYAGETKDKIIFDLYSGTGTISQILAPVAKKVVGVEIVEEAVQAARENAARNGLTNVEFISGDVLKKLDEITEKPDLIVLDPPRDGIHPKALTKIIDYDVEHLIYISCKPTSLVRNLKVLQERGYQVEKAACVDMFPQTANIETICCLTRIK